MRQRVLSHIYGFLPFAFTFYDIMTELRSQRPSWIRGKLPWSKEFHESEVLIRDLGLNSVCVEAACPNKGECWKNKHITFLILGDICTRGCHFCNVSFGVPSAPDKKEPFNIVEAVKKMNREYVVITSVTRDDLAGGGAEYFVKTVELIKRYDGSIKVELLIPDLKGEETLIKKIAGSGADVIGHNIETPGSLYGVIRPRSDYKISLETLRILSEYKRSMGFLTKSSIILGLGETRQEISITFDHLMASGVDILYLGQYLSPARTNIPVQKYYTPQEFELLKAEAKQIGFKAICSGPMVRSSFRAESSYREALLSRNPNQDAVRSFRR